MNTQKQELSIHEEQFQTPVLFLIFNRPGVTQKVFDQIKKVRPRFLFVAADGPREHRLDDTISCEETRKIIEQVDWPCELRTLFRAKNMGCGPAVSAAITWFFSYVEEGIILEDDCYPDLSFFPFCSELLERYRDNDKIKFIGGNNFQKGHQRGSGSYYFSHYPASWGWATWKRSWDMFNPDIREAGERIEKGELNHVFNSAKEKKHWLNSLKKAADSNDHIWDFHFYYAIWKNGGLCITPNQNLVVNLGFFEDGTHYFLKDSTKTNVSAESIAYPLSHPSSIAVNREADRYTYQHFYSHSLQRAIRLLRENSPRSIYHYLEHKLFKERVG